MNRGKGITAPRRIFGQHGYTIVEVLIFLAVSALLFGSTMVLLAGRQAKAQFTNAVRDFETRILDVANDVSNGYYQSPGDIRCNAIGSITVSESGGEQGANKDCILLGRVIKLGYGSGQEGEKYGVYTLIGKRTTIPGGGDVSGLASATPRLLWVDTPSSPTINESLREKLNFAGGASIECISIIPVGAVASCDPAKDDNAVVAFVTTPTGEVQKGSTGGAITADVYYYASSTTLDPENKLVTDLNNVVPAKLDAGRSLVMCIKSGGSDQYALLTLKDGRISSVIKSGVLCS